MGTNACGLDRTLRVVIGAALIGWGIYAQSWWGAIGIIPLLTGIVGVCPAYKLLGISTCKVKQQ
ncbi:MAG: DUF2892 domain-containing protein [Fimbriimonadales bacterium]|nr:DUF2892 domain-containing protein [Fimbriimonadales bacterium]